MQTYWENVWQFHTRNFTIALDVTEEMDSPEGHFEDAESVAFAQEGGWHWFTARVRVLHDGQELGADYLGACSYHSLEDFMEPGGYFRDMIREACAQARHELRKLQSLHMRSAA
jgi:hypothetical protein